MVGNFYGADVAQLRQLAKDMANGANRLSMLGQQLGGSVASSPWKGDDADRFRSDWNSSHARVLLAAADGIQTASKALLRNAEEQDKASNDGAGSGGAGGAGNPSNSVQTTNLTDTLSGMSPAERDAYLRSDEFRAWVSQSQENADAAKAALDQLADSGGLPVEPENGAITGYAHFLKQYWSESAMREAGIDPLHWDPTKGVGHNRDDIYDVYAFYAELYKNDPRMEWIGMANQVGPTFIAGFEDIAVLHKVTAGGESISDYLDGVDPATASLLTQLARMGEADLKFYETTFLSMQKEIFEDIGSQHYAYQQGGIAEIQRLERAGVVNQRMALAWTLTDSVPPYSDPQQFHSLTPGQQAALHNASYNMADQEQNYVIADDYDDIRGRPTGQLFTNSMTMVGEPSIEGAKKYYEQFPAVEPYFDVNRFPVAGVDVHHGNISVAADRWNLIDQDTLGAYERWLHGEKDPYGEMTKPMDARVDEYRMVPKQVRDLMREP
ncbi:WXG100 family type VII secretion target [Arthrobacter sp. SA17]